MSYRIAYKPKGVYYDIPPDDQAKEIINALENILELMLFSLPEIHQIRVIPGSIDAPIESSVFICSDIHSLPIVSTKKHVTVWEFRILNIARSEMLSQSVHYPTLPSSEIEISFCASTANSIGSCCNTSLTKPLTTSAVASSADMPRCWQ